MSSSQSQGSTSYALPSDAGFAATALVGTLTGLALYGLFFVLFCTTIHIQCFRRKAASTNCLLLGASIAIFVLTTMNIILQSHRLLIGLLYTPAGYTPDSYFPDCFDWPNVFEISVELINVLVADAVMLYRVWAVWSRRWQFIVFNMLLWFATIGSTIRVIQLLAVIVQNPTDYAGMDLMGRWALAVPALSFAQTTTATGLIAFRLWKVDRAASAYKEGSLLPVVRILVESGAIYTALMLVDIVVSYLKNVAVTFVPQLVSPIIGITFSLIIVRVGLGLSNENPTTQASTAASYPSRRFNLSIPHQSNVTRQGQDDTTSTNEEGAESVGMKGLVGKSSSASGLDV